jgi:hypothetical protein
MNICRAYCFGRDGKIFKAKILECKRARMLLLARLMIDGYDIEVWHGSRRITQLQHQTK